MAYLDPNEAVPCHAESAARERFDRKREAEGPGFSFSRDRACDWRGQPLGPRTRASGPIVNAARVHKS